MHDLHYFEQLSQVPATKFITVVFKGQDDKHWPKYKKKLVTHEVHMVCVVHDKQGDTHGVHVNSPVDLVDGYVRFGQVWRHLDW
jgi:hypothetical protein